MSNSYINGNNSALRSGPGGAFTPFPGPIRPNPTNAALTGTALTTGGAAVGAGVSVISHVNSGDAGDQDPGGAAEAAQGNAGLTAHGGREKARGPNGATAGPKTVHLDGLSLIVEQHRELAARIAEGRRQAANDEEVWRPNARQDRDDRQERAKHIVYFPEDFSEGNRGRRRDYSPEREYNVDNHGTNARNVS